MLDTGVVKLTSKIDQAAANSAQLTGEVSELQAALAALAQEEADMGTMRQAQLAQYVTAKADLELGVSPRLLGGAAAMLQQPAKPELHTNAGGVASSIIGILEVCGSGFESNFAKEESAESDALSAYDASTRANKLGQKEKDHSVVYKTQKATGLGEEISVLSSVRAIANTELDAVLEFYGKLEERCIGKQWSYEERKGRRGAVVASLKQALAILVNETAFVQRKHRSMRGALVAQ